MLAEIGMAVVSFFSIATVIALLIFARSRKKAYPWNTFALLFLLLFGGSFAMLTRTFEVGSEEITSLFILIPVTWLIAIFLLARANREDALEKQYSGLSALNEISKSYMKFEDPEKAAKASLTVVAEAFNADGGLVFFIDKSQKKVEMLSSFGQVPEHAMKLVRILSTRTMFDGKTIHRMIDLDEDLKKIHDKYIQESRKAGYKSIFGYPISTFGIFGMLVLFSRRKMGLSEQDKEILKLLAFELGMWMEGVRNIANIKQMSELKKGLLESSLALQSEIRSEDIILKIIDRLMKLVPAWDLVFYLYDSSRDIMWPEYAVGGYAKETLADGDFPLSEAGIAEHTIRTGKAEIIRDVRKDKRYVPVTGLPTPDITMISIPLKIKGEPIGVIQLGRKHPDKFSKNDFEIATLFAQQASIAIENSRLIHYLEQEKTRAQVHIDILTHDVANLNTPLCSYFELMRQRGEMDEISREFITKSADIVDKLTSLVHRVRKLSKIDIDEPEMMSQVDLFTMLEEAAASLKKSFPDREIDIAITQPEEDMSILAGEFLDEILLNLMHNAVKKSPDNVKMEISIRKLQRDGEWFYCAEISDHGKGFKDREKKEIFEEITVPATDFAKGFGIGLGICRKLMEKYNGSITVEDRVKGDYSKGTRFVLLFPVFTNIQYELM